MGLDLPLSGLENFEHLVGLPSFIIEQSNEEDNACNQVSHYQERFISQIMAKRLMGDLHNSLSNSK